MARTLAIGVGLSAALALTPALAQGERLPTPSVDHRVELRVDDAAETLVLYHSGERLRQEMVHEGEEVVVILDLDAGQMIVLEEAYGERMAMVMPLLPQMAAFADPNEHLAFMADGPVTVRTTGSEEIVGHPCTVYEVAGESDGQPFLGELCLSEEGILLRSRMQGLGPDMDGSAEAVALEIGPQDPVLFEIPEGYRVERAPGMQ